MTTPKNEREAWLGTITPEDIDRLMADNGQAEANARHVQAFFRKYPLAPGSRILVAGCGTCQMLDYLKPADLGNVKCTFSDISVRMLEAAQQRLRLHDGFSYEVIIDDLENTSITQQFDAVLLSLVLLHLEWKKCLLNVSNLNINRVYVIEQEQTPGTPVAGSRQRPLPPTIKKYAETVSIKLVSRPELIRFLAELGYELVHISETCVPDEKVMVGLVFQRLQSI